MKPARTVEQVVEDVRKNVDPTLVGSMTKELRLWRQEIIEQTRQEDADKALEILLEYQQARWCEHYTYTKILNEFDEFRLTPDEQPLTFLKSRRIGFCPYCGKPRPSESNGAPQ